MSIQKSIMKRIRKNKAKNIDNGKMITMKEYKETAKKWRQENKDYKTTERQRISRTNKDKIQKQRQQTLFDE